MVEGDGGVGQGQVLEDDVEAHCRCEWEHWAETHRVWDEEGNIGPREEVERDSGDEEVESGKGNLRMAKSRIVEDGFVREDLQSNQEKRSGWCEQRYVR